jgi:hypothetical protein
MMPMIGKLNTLIDEKRFQDKFVVLFGANSPGDKVINHLSSRNIAVNAIIDNNANNTGKSMLDIPIHLPGELLGEYKDNLIVLICSRYYAEMRAQLEKMGYVNDRHIIKLLDMNAGINYSTTEDDFTKTSDTLIETAKIYNQLIGKYGGDVTIFVCPTKANGDIYLSGLYLKQYLRKEKIHNYVVAVIGETCRKICKLFGLENVERISQENADSLVKIRRITGNANIKILQPYYDYTSIATRLEGYKNINFSDFYKYAIFNLDEAETAEVNPPENRGDKKRVNRLFSENKLVNRKTAVLSPHANSMPAIHWKFWIQLADELNQRGYSVCTNSMGASEPAVPHTTSICCDMEDAILFCEQAGTFIALRNGLCDVVSSANCRKIIIYPDKTNGFGKVIDNYGLQAMGLSNQVKEIEYDGNIESMLNQVLEYV